MRFTRRGGLIALVAVAGSGMAGYSMLAPGHKFPIKFANANLLAALDARSPGERQAGALTTKHKVASAAGPKMAMLGAHEPAPVAAALGSPAPVAGAVVPAIAGPAAVVPATAVAPLLAPAAIPVAAFAGPGAGAFLPLLAVPAAAAIGGGGGGGTTTAVVPAPDNPTPAPAVPEPATWLMMILGFGFLGSFLRRRRALDQRPARATLSGTAPAI
ncbi:PEP-CTERM sorting domain-containing protein [Sphingomonas ginkgonis]|uniref:PEP-CTERM sorting domain-containing protein n=1 Tax=Sphingomonas ginkgonis TaxID=2315330 RepID=A0A3R9YMY6_9SPHN|nr:PEPxxWA-CTERM sorting domain-containing protein [Sphingomonas ginkgonis]RST31458.1 PEP-CTERM sorting domain-containing protein [Sphingomonas ginkgonis]